MDDADFVRGVETPRHLLEDFSALGHGQRASRLERMTKCLALEIFHGDVGSAIVGLARLVDGHDIGMTDARRGGRFIVKTQEEFRIIQQPAVQDL